MARIETAARRKAERRGRRAEWLAALALMCKGWRPIGRRVKTPVGEIDLIVTRGRVLAAVEVKQRGDVMSGFDAVPPRARQRMARALDWWLARHPRFAAHDLRFDLVVVAPRRWPCHVPSAFEPHA
jgi:putative endonuclease